MSAQLTSLRSIINNSLNAKDNTRCFTFIEFIKEFGYENTPSSFLNDYKLYLSLWAAKSNENLHSNDKAFVQENLLSTLKSIVLTYSSYEEQDFIANIDWNNEMHRRAIIPFFAEKIKNICDFYKLKRQDAPLIINKNNFKGSKESIEQIIYDKIVDYYFNNKNLKPQISELQNNLTITIEQYVDIYSDYFDIPRNKKCSDETRNKFLSININTPRYEDYISVAKVVSDTLFGGEVHLEEIPLIAQVGLDLSQKCAGDVATLRDNLLNKATINLVSLNDQIALRRKLYEKYLGCDLYYIYCDTKDSIFINLLTKAENPSGNLLNCGTADTAAVEADSLELLTNIGLFFKPDKMGILKTNADNFSWEIDKSKLKDETFYVFPDPNKYGDIGNNKHIDYPLIFEFKLDSYIKNISSGYAKDEPLVYLSATTWDSYYTTQDRDYILDNNQNYTYSFTNLSNIGLLTNYTKDLYGNEYGLIKGFTEDENNLYVPSKFSLPEVSLIPGGPKEEYEELGKRNVSFNGGYFRDPRTIANSAFPHNEQLRLKDDYIWTTIDLNCSAFTIPDDVDKNLSIKLDMGSFEPVNYLKLNDHYKVLPSYTTSTSKNNKFTTEILFNNFASSIAKLKNKNVIKVDKSYEDLKNENGKLFIKEPGKAPYEFIPTYNEGEKVDFENNIKNYGTFDNVLVLEFDDKIEFYSKDITDGLKFYNINSIHIADNECYKILYNESKNSLIIAILKQRQASNNTYDRADIILYEFDINTRKINLSSPLVNTEVDNDAFKDHFEYVTYHTKINDFVFTYNNDLDIYLLAFLTNINASPFIYQHKFRLYNKDRFYSSIKSERIFDSINGQIQLTNIINQTINTTSNPFFIVDNG
jgi:hypothetical protein